MNDKNKESEVEMNGEESEAKKTADASVATGTEGETGINAENVSTPPADTAAQDTSVSATAASEETTSAPDADVSSESDTPADITPEMPAENDKPVEETLESAAQAVDVQAEAVENVVTDALEDVGEAKEAVVDTTAEAAAATQSAAPEAVTEPLVEEGKEASDEEGAKPEEAKADDTAGAPAEEPIVSAEATEGAAAGAEVVKKSIGRELLEWVLVIVVAVAAALLIRTFIFEPVRVDGNSMNNTLMNQEYMIVTKYQYLFNDPQRFDVVICRYPGRGNTNFVKRIVGIPGDVIAMQDGILYVNGEAIDEPYIDYPANYSLQNTEVMEGHYFVLGDNRSSSNDSHAPGVGQLTRDQIIGKVRLVAWPISAWRMVR